MVKKIFRGIGRIFFPIRNVKRALGLAELKTSFQNSRETLQSIFTPAKTKVVKETFEEAMVRCQLTEDSLRERLKSLIITMSVYAVLAVICFAYAIYMLSIGLVLGAFISFVLTITAVGFAYRDHFWYVQIKCRRLGMSFKDWAHYTFGSIKK